MLFYMNFYGTSLRKVINRSLGKCNNGSGTSFIKVLLKRQQEYYKIQFIT